MAGGGFPDADVLSDVLAAVRLTSALFFRVEASSPWVAEAPAGSAMAPVLFREGRHVISYHVLLEGSCYCELPGDAPVQLSAGDIVVIPHGDRYALSSHPGMLGLHPEQAILEWFEQTVARAVPDPFNFVEGAGETAARRLLCGFLGCDAAPFNPVLGHLPRLIRLSRRSGDRDERLVALIALAQAELRERRAGKHCVLLRISELLFVEVVREYLASSFGERAGWFAGLRDPLVGCALGLLHGAPAHPWTVDELARRSGASRSILAERFSELLGQPPMQYLTHWRMQLAARRLCDGRAKVSAVAEEVGYDSEAAFSRAFKSIVGVPPAAFRRSHGREMSTRR